MKKVEVFVSHTMTSTPAINILDLDWRSPDAQALLMAGIQSSPALSRVVPMLDRSFLIRSDWAPGGRFMGAQMRLREDGKPDAMINVIGSGLAIERAIQSCLGEAIERFSSVDEGHVPLRPMALSDFLTQAPADIALLSTGLAAANGTGADAVFSCLSAQNSITGSPTLIPAEWCLRGLKGEEHLAENGRPRSLGVAAGRTWEEAAFRAVLELVERDSVALWWLGTGTGNGIPLEMPGMPHVVETLMTLRSEEDRRRTWLLDISTDLALPCVVALSADKDNADLCIGTAARATHGEAIEAAIFEMCQSEIGLAIAQTKLSGGRPDLISDDERHALARAGLLHDPECLRKLTPGTPFRSSEGASTPVTTIRDIADHLHAHGISVYLADIRKPPFEVPVVCAIAPVLQPYPSSPSGPVRARLGRYIKETADIVSTFRRTSIL